MTRIVLWSFVNFQPATALSPLVAPSRKQAFNQTAMPTRGLSVLTCTTTTLSSTSRLSTCSLRFECHFRRVEPPTRCSLLQVTTAQMESLKSTEPSLESEWRYSKNNVNPPKTGTKMASFKGSSSSLPHQTPTLFWLLNCELWDAFMSTKHATTKVTVSLRPLTHKDVDSLRVCTKIWA